jgi:hypothetical protein
MEYQGLPVTTNEMTTGWRNAPARTAPELVNTASKAPAETGFSRRSIDLEWDETMLDYAAIEKHAQKLRAEAAWRMASAVREWAVKAFGQGKAKVRAATQAPFGGHSQAT